VTPDVFEGFPEPTINYEWYRCDNPVSTAGSQAAIGCVRISGATLSSYVLTSSDHLKHIVVRTVATNSLGSVTRFSASTASVTGANYNTVSPVISGTSVTGSTLTVSPGTWVSFPATVTSYQWYRCSSFVFDSMGETLEYCSSIPNATSSSYTQVSEDAGKYITVQTSNENSEGVSRVWSHRTTATNAPLSLSSSPSISGSSTVGTTLSVEPGVWGGSPAPNFDYQWYSCDNEIVNPGSTLPSGCQETNQYVQVSTGQGHTCALLDSGAVHCWGANYDGQLGNNSTQSSSMPVQVEGISTAISVSANFEHSCAVLADGSVECWGKNSSGQLGNSSSQDSSIPVEVNGIFNATAVSTGSGHSCAVLADSTVRCWGSNSSGQLGNNSQISVLSPVIVSGLSTARSVSAGTANTCALLADGTVRCWGSNTNGQLGDNTRTMRLVPVSVFVSGATSISTSGQHTCALLANGTVRCWGSNTNGQLGDNSKTQRLIPTLVSGISTATSISVGNLLSCATLADGTARCWGINYDGRLGNNNTVQSQIPVAVFGLTGATEISASGHACALSENQSVKCWGGNFYGELGDDTTANRLVPVQVKSSLYSVSRDLIGRYLVSRITATNSLGSMTAFTSSTSAIGLP
jgi:alpha-tubulin suppressor-like RCC1 family protein